MVEIAALKHWRHKNMDIISPHGNHWEAVVSRGSFLISFY